MDRFLVRRVTEGQAATTEGQTATTEGQGQASNKATPSQDTGKQSQNGDASRFLECQAYWVHATGVA